MTDFCNAGDESISLPSLFCGEEQPIELTGYILSFCKDSSLYALRAVNRRCQGAADRVLQERTLAILPLGFSEVTNTLECNEHEPQQRNAFEEDSDEDDEVKFALDDEAIKRQRKVNLGTGRSNFSRDKVSLVEHVISEALTLDGANEVPFLTSNARRELAETGSYSAVADMDLYKMELHLQCRWTDLQVQDETDQAAQEEDAARWTSASSRSFDRILEFTQVIQLPAEQQWFLRKAAFSLLLNGGKLMASVETDCVCNEMHSWESPPATTFERKRTRALVFDVGGRSVELVFNDATSMDFM